MLPEPPWSKRTKTTTKETQVIMWWHVSSTHSSKYTNMNKDLTAAH